MVRGFMEPMRVLVIGADGAEQPALAGLLAGSDIALDFAADYDAALAAAAEAEYQVAVLSGSGGGLPVLRRAVAEERLGPVLWLVPEDDAALVEAGLSAGAADALPRPALTPLLFDRALRYAAERRRSDSVLRDLAMFDADTGLAKAELFWVILSLAVRRAQRNRDHLAVLLMSVQPDGGEPLADAEQRLVQRTIARRLTGLLRSTDTVARFDAHHMVALVESMPRLEDIQVVAEKLIAETTKPVAVPGRSVGLTVAVGISLYPAGATQPEALIGNATRAMARAQERGPNQFQFD
ncbi:MAG TPA: GGDEF domain-containing protein [Alphaproteobacteria bacterium]|nr:GGDEF domain-containing protein [Alphaproteobacteria bacterium]